MLVGRLQLVVALTVAALVTGMEDGGRMAECRFEGAVQGTVLLHWTNAEHTRVMFMGELSNLPQGKHGFHVHQVAKI